jgi:dihydrofolate synthase/folylpolyglutamate synthase
MQPARLPSRAGMTILRVRPLPARSMPRTLAEWLDYQQRVHPRAIELGLERVRVVWQRLAAPRPAPVVISVGGTNGKGSTTAFLQSMLTASGKRVGAYTSPHLLRYSERVRIAGREADDAALCAAFARIEAARGEIALTYFEFGTLAALLLFAEAALDVAVLEVGLGGRLDAVNLIDADVAIVTTVDLDHQDWLGRDRDSIGREKAGIFRSGRPAVIGERDPPQGLLTAAAEARARVLRAGRDFDVRAQVDAWRWWSQAGAGRADDGYSFADEEPGSALTIGELALAAPHQIDNAAAALAALWVLRDRLGWNGAAYVEGLAQARLPGRLQRLADAPELRVDVAHNPQAARELAAWLDAHPVRGRTLAVFSALADKDIAGIAAALGARIAHWHVTGIAEAGARGLGADAVTARLAPVIPADRRSTHADLAAALAAARASATPRDRIVAFGSFHVVAAVLAGSEAGAGV